MAKRMEDTFEESRRVSFGGPAEKYLVEDSQLGAIEQRLQAILRQLTSDRNQEVVGALESIKHWATAAEGWLRAPSGFTVTKTLLNCLKSKEKAIQNPSIEILREISSTNMGIQMLLQPSKFSGKKQVHQQVNSAAKDSAEVQDLLASSLRLMQQTTGVPTGRLAVFSIMNILENMMLVPATFEHISQMKEFWDFFNRLMNLHGMSSNDFKMTIVAGRLLKTIFNRLTEQILNSPRFPSLMQELTLQVKKGRSAVMPENHENSSDSVKLARQANVAVQDSREAQANLHKMMAKVEECTLEAERLENSDLVEERRASMHMRELLQEALREAEEAATILQVKENKAKKLLAVSPAEYDSDEKVMSAAASADDAAEMMAELVNSHQGRMQVLTTHPQVKELFEILCGALKEGICLVGAAKVLESITTPVGCGEWLMQTSGLAFEHDQRTRLTKFDIIRPVSNMLTSNEVVAQRTSLKVLMNLFRASHFMEPLHPSGEAVSYILQKLGACLSSDDEQLAMYAARLVNRLTGYHAEAAPRRAILMGDGQGETFIQSLCSLILIARESYDLANTAVTLCIFLCNEEVLEMLDTVLQSTQIIPELTSFQWMLGYSKPPYPSSETGEADDINNLSGEIRYALCHALCSEIPSAASAASEALMTISEVAEWRLWMISGRGDTSPTKIINMLLTLTNQTGVPKVASAVKLESNVQEVDSQAAGWFGGLLGGSVVPEAKSESQEWSKASEQGSVQDTESAQDSPKVSVNLNVGAGGEVSVQAAVEQEGKAAAEEEQENEEEIEEGDEEEEEEEVVTAGAGFGALKMDMNLPSLPNSIKPQMAKPEITADKDKALAAAKGNGAIVVAPSTVSRAETLSKWVATPGDAVKSVRPDFGEEPKVVTEEEANPVVWTGRAWMQTGAVGVVSKIFHNLATDPEVLSRLKETQDNPVEVATLLLHALCTLLLTARGAKHATAALDTLTSKPFGLLWLSALGPQGVDDFIVNMADSAKKMKDMRSRKTVEQCVARLEDAKPKK